MIAGAGFYGDIFPEVIVFPRIIPTSRKPVYTYLVNCETLATCVTSKRAKVNGQKCSGDVIFS